MSAYRTVETKVLRPDAEAVSGTPADGEWINAEPLVVGEARGLLRALPAVLADSILGQGASQAYRWRGALPEGLTPEPGWTIEIEGRPYRVASVVRGIGRTWRLDVERQG